MIYYLNIYSFKNQHEALHLIIYEHLKKIKSAVTNQQLGRSVMSYMSHMHQVNKQSLNNEISVIGDTPLDVFLVTMVI